MSQGAVAVYDVHGTLLGHGLYSAIQDSEGFDVGLVSVDSAQLLKALKTIDITMVFIVLPTGTDPDPQLISAIKLSGTRRAVVIVTAEASKEVVFKSIRAGANGLLTADTPLAEITEALYTLRNGHDYFAKSIANLLVSGYVDALRRHDNAIEARMKGLSKREIEVLALWGEGKNNAEIADKLFLSVRTVESHKNHIMQKLQLRTTVDLVRFAIRNNIIEL